MCQNFSSCFSPFVSGYPPATSPAYIQSIFKDKSYFIHEALSRDSGSQSAFFSLDFHKSKLLHPRTVLYVSILSSVIHRDADWPVTPKVYDLVWFVLLLLVSWTGLREKSPLAMEETNQLLLSQTWLFSSSDFNPWFLYGKCLCKK